ncbi:MAG: flagellar hook-basal body complex protein FliE [Gemmobacter sp.]|nr:flagellar hook-basal body complex protein FliE [Gemmobacter sp.]
MDIKGLLATTAYSSAKTATLPEPGSTEGAFGQMAESFANILSRGEDVAKAAMTGDADPHALVQALSATELAIETAVTLRDKVVEAYQEILRMPV